MPSEVGDSPTNISLQASAEAKNAMHPSSSSFAVKHAALSPSLTTSENWDLFTTVSLGKRTLSNVTARYLTNMNASTLPPHQTDVSNSKFMTKVEVDGKLNKTVVDDKLPAQDEEEDKWQVRTNSTFHKAFFFYFVAIFVFP